jgi:hypothetical protein
MAELAVLAEESPGVPFRRLRSTSPITNVILMYTIRYSDVSQLRAISPAIDAAVKTAQRAGARLRCTAGCALSADQRGTVQDKLPARRPHLHVPVAATRCNRLL